MGHHFIGRIFLFHEPPQPTDFEIHVPALADDSAIPDAVLVNLPDEALNSELLSRKRSVFERYTLPADLIKRFASYELHPVLLTPA
jgi:hypothetical protein